MVQWLRLHTFTAGGMGSILGWETRIPLARSAARKEGRRKDHRQMAARNEATENPKAVRLKHLTQRIEDKSYKVFH